MIHRVGSEEQETEECVLQLEQRLSDLEAALEQTVRQRPQPNWLLSSTPVRVLRRVLWWLLGLEQTPSVPPTADTAAMAFSPRPSPQPASRPSPDAAAAASAAAAMATPPTPSAVARRGSLSSSPLGSKAGFFGRGNVGGINAAVTPA